MDKAALRTRLELGLLALL